MKTFTNTSSREWGSIPHAFFRLYRKKGLVCLFLLWSLLGASALRAQTYMVSLDASPKTYVGVTFTLSGSATAENYGYHFPAEEVATATITISKKINISTVYFDWGVNVQGASLEFYSGANLVKTIAWGASEATASVSANGIDKIIMRENGTSRYGLGVLTNMVFQVAAAALPTVATVTASGITSNSATLGGNITADGGTSVTERGVVYGTTANPTTANTKVQIGSGTGAFSQNITALAGNTKYYVRAYAINAVGTAYGSETSFTTLSALPANELSFNGTDQYVAIPNKTALEFATGTVEMWVKPAWSPGTHNGASPCLISMRSVAGTRFSLHINSNLSNIGIWNGLTSLSIPYSFTQGQWYHVAAVMKASTTDFYINGSLIGSTLNTLKADASGYDLKIGASELGTQHGTNERFEGAIDEVRVWNTMRTATDIQQNYSNPVSTSSTGLVAYYPIGAGITGPANALERKVADYSANAFHGTLYHYYSSDANLSNLALSQGTLSPAFASGTTSYSATVANSVAAINLTPTAADAKASLKVNGSAATSGSAASISLHIGANTIPVLITAEDGTQKTYTVTVSRAASSNASLASITLSAGSLSPVFAAGTTSYTAAVGNGVSALQITPTLADATASISVNGTAATSGSAVTIPLAVGDNTITVAITAQDGTTSATYTIQVSRAYPAVVLTTAGTNVSCNGGSNGAAMVTASGGVAPFTYSWSPAGGNAAAATGLSAGSYTVTVTDAARQTATATVTVSQPPVLAATGTQTNVSCNGGTNGSATVTVTGGTAPYTYAWAPAGGTSPIPDPGIPGSIIPFSYRGLAADGSNTVSGLAAGLHTVTVTDAKGCTITQEFTITQPDALTASVAKTDATMVGGADGTATVTASGGTDSYTYAWAPAGGSAATATGLAAGTYTVTITDANHCAAIASVTIGEPTSTRVLAITTTDASPTNAGIVHYSLTLSQPVTGVSADNFTVTTATISGASIASVTASNPSTYLIAVNTGTGSGELNISMVNDDDMSLLVENLPFAGTGPYTIDKLPPAAPSAPDLLAASDSGPDDSDNITKNTSLLFAGTAAPETSIKLFAGATEAGSTTSDENGNWQVTAAGFVPAGFTAGAFSFTAKAADALGNSSGPGAALEVTIDLTTPGTPEVTGISADTGVEGADGITSDNTLTISGAAEALSKVEVSIDGAVAGTTDAGADAVWSYDHTAVALSAGTHTVQVTATDLAGNTSQESSLFTLTIDQAAPVAPVITAISDDTGLDPADGVTSDKNIRMTGSAAPGTSVSVALGADTYGPVTADADGQWILDLTALTLPDAAYSAMATSQDAAGNTSAAREAFAFVIDNALPAEPQIVAIGEDSGVSPADGITKDQTLTISGTAEARHEVSLLLNNAAIGTTLADAAGNWTYTYPTTLAEGFHTLQAKARSVSGIESRPSASFPLAVDLTVPAVVAATSAAPVVKAPFEVTFTFSEAVSGFETEDLSLTNATAILTASTATTYTVLLTPTTDGAVTGKLKADAVTDLAGNKNAASDLIARLYDAQLPEVTLASSAPQATNAAFMATFTFTEPVLGFGMSGITVVNGLASDFITLNPRQYTALITPTTDGTVSVQVAAAAAQDMATNSNLASVPLERTFDATPPTATLTTTAADPTNAPFTANLSFSEDVFDFAAQDILVDNGTVSDFTKVNGQLYTALIAPLADGQVTVTLATGVTRDVAANGNAAAGPLRRLYDGTAPAGYAIAFRTGQVDVTNVTNINLGISGAEATATYFYSITSSKGGTPVSGSAIAAGAAFEIPGINVSGLSDGQLRVTFYQQDAAGNRGAEATAQVMKYTRNLVSFTRPATLLVPIRTTFAQAGLPATIEVTYSDNTRQSIPVAWAPGNYNGLVAGSYELSGTLTLAAGTTNLDQVQARITVEIQPNKAPTALALSTTRFNPNIAGMDAATAEAIGAFTTTDADDNQHTYALVNGTGSTDNGLFEIVGSALFLKTNKGLSGQTSFAIRVRSTDPYDNAIEQSFTLSKEAYAKPVAELKVVNTFSPNGDGNNDTWVIPELRFYNNVQVEIYDREGKLLFRSTDPEMGWDGKASNGLPLKGAVLYVVQIKDINLVKKGVVTILRK